MSVSPLRLPPTPEPAINFAALLHKLDSEFGNRSTTLIESFRFELDGMKVDIRRITQKNGFRFLVTATLGCLPFSIESSERREAIKAIIVASRILPKVRFSVDHTGKIIAGALLDITSIAPPDFVFYPLTLFLQEARPFMRLIGQYLEAEHCAPPTPCVDATDA